jgi:hypothetical protein
MGDLEYVRAYIDDLLIITKGTYLKHLQKLATVLSQLQRAGLKLNVNKSWFSQEELAYLHLDSQNRIQPTQEKVATVLDISAPAKEKELSRFIGMVNYYRDMWIRQSDVFAPLTTLTSKTVPWKWSEEHQRSFDLMK